MTTRAAQPPMPHPASSPPFKASVPADAQLLLLDKHQVESMLLPADVLEAVRALPQVQSARILKF